MGDDGYARADDGYGIGQRCVRDQVTIGLGSSNNLSRAGAHGCDVLTTGVKWATTGVRRVSMGRTMTGLTLYGRVHPQVIRASSLVRDSGLQLTAPDSSSPGALCRTYAEFLWTGWADAREICSKTNDKKLLSPWHLDQVLDLARDTGTLM